MTWTAPRTGSEVVDEIAACRRGQRDTGPDHEAAGILADARHACVTEMLDAAQRTPERHGCSDVPRFVAALYAWALVERAETLVFRAMVEGR